MCIAEIIGNMHFQNVCYQLFREIISNAHLKNARYQLFPEIISNAHFKMCIGNVHVNVHILKCTLPIISGNQLFPEIISNARSFRNN